MPEVLPKENKSVSIFRKLAIAEGISFLILLLIAMPLKYAAGWPYAVQYVGWAHGVLFVALLLMSLPVKQALHKNFFWLVTVFIASLIPLGTFWLDRQISRELKARAFNKKKSVSAIP